MLMLKTNLVVIKGLSHIVPGVRTANDNGYVGTIFGTEHGQGALSQKS